jgi:hypothetical protein
MRREALLSLPGMEHRFLRSPARSEYAIPTELFWVLLYNFGVNVIESMDHVARDLIYFEKAANRRMVY